MTNRRKTNIEINRMFTNWCVNNNLNLKENHEVFFVNERILMKPEYVINNRTFIDIIKNGEFNENNTEHYKNFAYSFGTLILIKEEDISELINITKEDVENKYNFNF